MAQALATEAPPVYDEEATEILRFWKSRTKYSSGFDQEIIRRALIAMLQTGEARPYGHRAAGRADHELLIRTVPVPLLTLGGDREMLNKASKRAAEIAPDGRYFSLGDTGMDVADEASQALVDAVCGLREG